MVISEGWDIPRACMLYQVRETQSDQLNEQVIGRVRRNPRLLDFEDLSKEAQDLATIAWMWGVISESKKKVISKKLDNSYNIKNEIKTKKPTMNTELLNLNDFIEKQSNVDSFYSIFNMYKKLNKADNEIKKCVMNIQIPMKNGGSLIII